MSRSSKQSKSRRSLGPLNPGTCDKSEQDMILLSTEGYLMDSGNWFIYNDHSNMDGG